MLDSLVWMSLSRYQVRERKGGVVWCVCVCEGGGGKGEGSNGEGEKNRGGDYELQNSI